jgi:hypothetical protein
VASDAMKTRRKGQGDRPVNEAEIDPQVLDHIRESRHRYRETTLAEVVSAALAYDAESRREDPLHRARSQQRKNDLRSAIEHAHDAMHRGPITGQDVDFAERIMEFRARRANSSSRE